MSVFTVTVLSNGQPMPPEYELLSVDIVKEVCRIPYAQLVLVDGSVAEQQFKISEAAFFEPGKAIDIKLRYEDEPQKEAVAFKGVVIGVRVEADASGSRLAVELKDAAMKMTVTRKSAVFLKKKDSDIISGIIADNGLKKGKVTATQATHEELAQYNCTDWDFVLLRAEANGLLIVADDGEISLVSMEGSGQPTHKFEYGISEIFSFEIEADAGKQYEAVETSGWDIKQQKLIKGKAKPFSLSQGNLNGQTIAKTLGVKPFVSASSLALPQAEVQGWSDSLVARNRMALIRGHIGVPGQADIKLLDMIEVSGVSARFNGKTLVTGLRHRIGLQGWQTDVQFGLPPERFAQRPEVMDVPAAGLLAGIQGLHIGLVNKIDEDPVGHFRVQVELPEMSAGDKKALIWARLASPYAGAGHGFFFMPEVNDEVVVGFFGDDPRQPVVLGSMYSSKSKQPPGLEKPAKDNAEKAIVTQNGITLLFKDVKDKPSLVIKTKGKNSITIDDDKKVIEIADQHGNKITMDDKGILIKSAKDFKVDANGNVEIKGSKVDVK